MPKQKVIIISGPTASGKTGMSLELAKKLNAYIISADSRQIYQDMNIGTAKPAGQNQSIKTGITGIDKAYYIDDIPHFLIDNIQPDQNFTLADWQTQAEALLNSAELNSQFKVPMIVGGTGLYINSLTNDYELPQGEINEQLREELDQKSLEDLQKELQATSPETYAYIDLDNKRRVVRALEYVITNNKPFLPEQKAEANKYDILHLSINIDRDELYNRINKRVEKMMEQGLVAEVENLLKKYDKNLPSLSGIGYAEIINYLDQHKDANRRDARSSSAIALAKADCVSTTDKIKQHTRNYAKRQLTWFKRDEKIHWINNLSEAENLIKNFLSTSAKATADTAK